MADQQAKLDCLSWFGGILDGEGSFMIVRENRKWNTKNGTKQDVFNRPAIKIVNTLVEGLTVITSVLDEQGLPYHISWRKAKGYNKGSWTVEVQGIKRCLKWCEVFKPFIVWKRLEIDAMIAFCERRLERERDFKPGFNSHQRFPKYDDIEMEAMGILRGRRRNPNASTTTRPAP